MKNTMKSTYESPFSGLTGSDCGDTSVFNHNLDNFKSITMDDVANKNVGDVIMFRRIENYSGNKRDKHVTEYIGRIWKSDKSTKSDPDFSFVCKYTVYFIKIMYKRRGYVYKSKRYMNLNPQWERYDEHIYHLHSSRSWNGKYGYYLNLYYTAKTNSNFDIESMKDLPTETLRCYFSNKYIMFSDNQPANLLKRKRFIDVNFQYFEIPSIGSVTSAQIGNLLSETVSPKQAEEKLKILFNRFNYDIYRNIVDYI